MSFNATFPGSSSFGMPFGQHIFVQFAAPPPPRPEPPHDPGYVPPHGAFVMKARKLADGSWYVPGYKVRSLALGAAS